MIETVLRNNAVRIETLTVLADAIRTAHQTAPASWGISLFSNMVRLNVGPVEAIIIEDPPEVRIMVPTEAAAGWGKEIGRSRTYPSVGGQMLLIPEAHVHQVMSSVRSAHLDIVRTAALKRSQYNTSWRAAHSESVREYVESTVSVRLPSPGWL